MKIQPGKFYKCRDGRKARIYAVDGPVPYEIQGAVLFASYGWSPRFWPKSGKFKLVENQGRDLIAPWYEKGEKK